MVASAQNNQGFGSTDRTRMLKEKRVYPGISDEAVEYTGDERTPGQVNFLRARSFDERGRPSGAILARAGYRVSFR